MALYRLHRVTDRKTFTAQRVDEKSALFYFSLLTGDRLSLQGSGDPPYLLGSRPTPVGPVALKTPVYREDA